MGLKRIAGSAAGVAVALSTVFAPATAQAAQNNVVTIPLQAINSLDPAWWASQVFIDQGTVFEGLMGYDMHENVVPKIASHWTVSQDKLTWTFYLRKDAKWSNGKPVTANDFVYSWLRFASPQSSQAPMWASFLQDVYNAYNYHGGAVPASQVGLKVINPYELQIHLVNPMPDLLDWLPLMSAMPLYQASVDAHPTNWWLPQYFVGNGPYTVKSFVPNGQIDLVKNPQYVGRKGTYNVGNVDEIDLVPTPSTPVEAYMANKLDAAPINTPSDYAYVQKNSTLSKEVHKVPNLQLYSLAFDKSYQKSPLDNVNVRKAIALAVDRNVIANTVMNGTVSATDVAGPPTWPATKYEHGYSEDVAQAQKLLSEAGYPGGKGFPKISIYVPPVGDPTVAVGEAIAQQLKQNLGINLQVEPTSWSLLVPMIWGGYSSGVNPGFVLYDGLVDHYYRNVQDFEYLETFRYDYPPAMRQYLGKATTSANNPFSVQKYGNPNDAKLGVTWSDWTKLQSAYEADSKYLTSYMNAQSDPYYKLSLKPDPGYATVWQDFVSQWKQAKTAADKHTAWVSAWNWIGSGSGLDVTVYTLKNEPSYMKQFNIIDSHETYANQAAPAQAGAKAVQYIMDSFWTVPLYYTYNIYLEKPWLKNVVPNTFSWEQFFQLQYMKVLPH